MIGVTLGQGNSTFAEIDFGLPKFCRPNRALQSASIHRQWINSEDNYVHTLARRWPVCARNPYTKEATMSNKTKKLWLLTGAAISRSLLCWLFPSLPDLLSARVEVSTPITSFRRCKRLPMILF